MSYTANVYNVMLASPSDVSEERKAATDIILDWNNINTMTRKIVLMPIKWESNSIPSMGGRPQEIINKQLLENADLLIGIFWTRIGTSTGKAISGTVEEIENHIKSGKPAMLYFSTKPAVPDSIDSEQYAAVKKIKKEFQSQGLYAEFESLDDFKNKFSRNLSMIVNENNLFSGYNNAIIPVIENKNLKLIQSLSSDAKNLLIEASKDKNGKILKFDGREGIIIETNNIKFIQPGQVREEAKWRLIFDDLINLKLIEHSQIKTYRLTAIGYELVDLLLNT